jgi:hypothetical protein
MTIEKMLHDLQMLSQQTAGQEPPVQKLKKSK